MQEVGGLRRLLASLTEARGKLEHASIKRDLKPGRERRGKEAKRGLGGHK